MRRCSHYEGHYDGKDWILLMPWERRRSLPSSATRAADSQGDDLKGEARGTIIKIIW